MEDVVIKKSRIEREKEAALKALQKEKENELANMQKDRVNLVYNVQDLGRNLADQKQKPVFSEKKEVAKTGEITFNFGEQSKKKLDFSLKDKTNETIVEATPELEASRVD